MTDRPSSIEVLRPSAGDTIVLSFEGRLTRAQYEHVTGLFDRKLPAGVNVLILDSSVRLAHVISPEPLPEPHPADAKGFDQWLRERTEHAHREFMERTSKLPPCVRRTYSSEEIAKFYGIAHGGID